MPDLASAIRRSLELRGDAGTGWSLGWKINLWARLYDCERAYRLILLIFNLVDLQRSSAWQMGGLYPNLFGAHPPFQIDGNFAFTAGVAEMLVQSHLGVIHLLPALPTAWPEGHVCGLRARGGFEIEITWHDGLLSQAKIISRQGGICRVRAGRKINVMEVEHIAPTTEEGSGVIAFETQRGKSYQLLAKR
jgi:alpha-L-fucosidase 2